MIQEQIDDPDALVIEYVSISKDIQAQYIVARFHSNPEWNKNPVCIMNYRLSVYLLPETIEKASIEGISDESFISSAGRNRKYAIDTIYCNYDICYDMRELYDLISRQYYAIAMA